MLEGRFRSAPHYELIPFSEIPPAQQSRLREFQEDPEFYGVLRPREGEARTVKSVGRDAAELFRRLRDPGRVPDDIRRRLGDDGASAVAILVLDGVLEIEWKGEFVSEARAFPLLFDDDADFEADGRLAELSLDALRYADAHPESDSIALAQRLYRFNTEPASSDLHWRFPTPHDVADFLELDRYGDTATLIRQEGAATPSATQSLSWLRWRVPEEYTDRDSDRGVFKLYVSPALDGLPEALRAVACVVGRPGISMVKVGKDVFGLLRPDKLIVYCNGLEVLHEVADELRRVLAGMQPHGVPFTADIGGDGLLSWGIDPPGGEGASSWHGRVSWRRWVTDHLATAIVAARHADAAVPAWRFALGRIRLEGVDPKTWTPRETIWRDDRGDH
jgi:hypothetical protein